MTDKDGFEYTTRIGTAEAIEYLNEIAEGLRAPTLTLEGGGQAITLIPQDAVKLKVKADVKDDKNKLKLEFSWKVLPVAPAGGLGITTTNNAPAEPVRPRRKPKKVTTGGPGPETAATTDIPNETTEE